MENTGCCETEVAVFTERAMLMFYSGCQRGVTIRVGHIRYATSAVHFRHRCCQILQLLMVGDNFGMPDTAQFPSLAYYIRSGLLLAAGRSGLGAKLRDSHL